MTVNDAFHNGDLLARLLIEETGKHLAAGVVSIVNAFNPCVVVLGGGIIENMPELYAAVKDKVPDMALQSATSNLKIVKASLGGEAAVIGAASLAQNLLTKP
jgi:glucokinase